MIIVVAIVATILMRLFFKNSFFRKMGVLWVLTIILDSINTEARLTFEDYPQALAMPIGMGIIGTIILSSRIVTVPLKNMVNTTVKMSESMNHNIKEINILLGNFN